ncbi:MAG: PP2C family protein-serine/threonine phosphatase [Prevotella sp.]
MKFNKINITASSNVGLVRHNNEDMILVRNKYIRNESYKSDIYLETCERFVVAVADGMGGYNAGEVASQEVLSSLHFFIGDLPMKLSDTNFIETLVEWLNSTNATLNTKGQLCPETSNMGTTLVGIIVYQNKFFWINCGDSRLYRMREGKLMQVSTDHSLNTLLGEKTHSNVVTNCIGAGCDSSYLDIFEFTNDIRHGDIYLMCSDGLSDMVDDKSIEQLLGIDCDAQQLCQAAIDAGGFDNVSACVMKII